MKKLAITSTLSLLIASSALAQAPDPSADASPPDATPTDPSADAPADGTSAADAAAVPEESFDPALLGGEGTMSAEELEKLGFGGGSPAVDTDLKVFGFADVNFSLFPTPKSDPYRRATQPHSQFFVGNINMFLSKNLSESVRMMTEVRFHYSPHGTTDLVTREPIVNQYGDPADAERPVHLGGVEIERVYVEWSMIPQLSMRVGQFFTPYGVWNVDHGSPVYIPPVRPFVIGSALFPERQTGFEFLGRTDLSTNNTVGYHFTLSNGLGPVSEIKDLDENKGVGGRLLWENRTLGNLRVGGSIFYAKDTTTSSVQGLTPSGEVSTTEKIETQSKVLSLAVDMQWRYAGWHLQSEVITQQRTYTDGNRHAASNPLTGQPLFPSDFTSWGAYGLLGYGFDVRSVNLMPWLLVNSFDQVQQPSSIHTKTRGFTAGFNVRPIDALVIKLSYNYYGWPDGSVLSDKPVKLIQTQVAWAF
jgi:hypothetical protein